MMFNQIDKSTIKKIEVHYKKPDGKTGKWPAYFSAKNPEIIEFEHDFDMEGEWTLTMQMTLKQGQKLCSIPQKRMIAARKSDA